MSEAAVWDRLAPRYGAIVRAFDTSYPRIRRALEHDLAGAGRVLELAAGTGQFTPCLAALAKDVVATDVSPKMVDVLAQTLGESSTVQARVMSAYAIEERGGSFDAVFCANALHVMDEPEQALAEIRRVLRTGGRLVAPTFLHGVDAPRRLLSRALSVVSPFVARSRFDLDALTSLIAGAGFEVARAETMRGVFPVGYVVARRS